jgi:hypothetical protein
LGCSGQELEQDMSLSGRNSWGGAWVNLELVP